MSLTAENQRQSLLNSTAEQLTPLQRAVLPWIFVAWSEGSLDTQALQQLANQLPAESIEAVRLFAASAVFN